MLFWLLKHICKQVCAINKVELVFTGTKTLSMSSYHTQGEKQTATILYFI